MQKLLLLVTVLVGTACAPTGYYVADIQPGVGGIEVTKCAFDDRGKATTNNCKTETVTVVTAQAPDPADDPEPAGAPPRPMRPAPTADAITAAFSAPSVHTLLLQCRDQYAKGVTSFAFKVTVAHSGKLKSVDAAAGTDATFAACATRALNSANIARFDGPPVTFDQTLPL